MTPTRYIRANSYGTVINPVRRARREAVKAAGGIRQFKKEEKLMRLLQKDLLECNGFFFGSSRSTRSGSIY